MSTPPPHQQDAPKTPGWRFGLFGILSTSKKPPADESSSGHGRANLPRPTPFPSNRLTKSHLKFPQSSPAFTSTGSATGIEPSASITSGAPSQTGLVGTMYTPSKTTVGVASKSPWKSPATAMNGVRFSHGSMKKSSAARKIVPASVKRRQKATYKPSSALLIKPRSRRSRPNSIDSDAAVNALEQSRGVFAPSTRQIEEKKNFSSFKSGKRLFGSNHRISRLATPKSVAAVTTTDEIGEQRASKRQKKVCFDNNSEKLTWQTPSHKTAPREATPYKPMDTDTDTCTESISPATKSQKLPDRPRQPLLLAVPPYDKFADPEDLGDPLAVTVNLFDFSVTQVSEAEAAQASETQPTSFDSSAFEREQEERRKAAKEKERSNNGYGLGDPASNKPQAMQYWTCHSCKKENPDDESACLGCKARRKATGLDGWGDMFADQLNQWKCVGCEVLVEPKFTICPSCEKPRSDSTGTSSTSPTTAMPKPSNSAVTESGFVFKTQEGKPASTPGAITGSGFTFGGTAAGSSTTQPTQTTAAQPNASGSTVGFSFPGTTTTSTNDSGSLFSSASSSTVPPPAGSTMNGNKPTPNVFGGKSDAGEGKKSQESPKSNLNFARSENKTPNTPVGTGESSFKFPIPATEPTSKRSRPGPNGGFAAPNSTSKVTEQKPFSSSLFGGQATTAKPEETSGSTGSQQNKPFSFGVVESKREAQAAPQPQPPAVGLFGQTASTPSVTAAEASSKVAPSFGGNASSAGNGDRAKRRRDGGNADKGSNGTSTDSTATGFGTSSSESAPPPPKLAFGSSQGGSGLFGSKAIGNNGGTDKKPFESATPAVPFGSTAPPPASAPAPGETTGTPNLFGIAPTPDPAGAPFKFGEPKQQTANNAPANPPFQFGGGSVSTAQEKTSGMDSAAPAASAGPTFGNSAPAPAIAAPFGGAVPGQSSNAPQFGSSSASGLDNLKQPGQNMFGQAPTAQSANPFSSGPAPAAAPTAPKFSFGSGSTNASSAPFGGTPTPATTPAAPFSGANVTSNPPPVQGFGAPTVSTTPVPGFGGATSNPQTGFGAPTGGAPFGATPGFGGGTAPAPANSTPMFGAPPPAAAPAGPGFFGASTPQAPAPAPFPSFGGGAPPGGGNFGGFGNSTPAPQGQANGMGGFPPPQQPGGFGGGFGGGNPPPPAANPPAAGMGGFSIGTSGKSTGRRRFIRAKRPGGSGAPRQA